MHRITKEQEEFLNKCADGTWKLNTDSGLVDIDGLFDCSNKGLSDFLGIEFGRVSGYFDCSNNQLVSLEGAPIEVMRYFDCSNNQLVSLEGAPQEVGGGFYCYNNQLVSLESGPQKVGWYLTCDVITLRDCPIDLLDKIYFYQDNKSFILKDLIINGLDPDIYFKKMI